MNKNGGIECPICGEVCDGKIVDSRRAPYGKRRRRYCERCGEKFTTIELAVTNNKDLFRLLFGRLGGKA